MSEKICPIMSRPEGMSKDWNAINCQQEKCALWVWKLKNSREEENIGHCGLIK